MTRVGVRNRSGDSGGSAATFFISYHGTAHTHMDTPCHFFYKGKMYNRDPMEGVTYEGAGKNGILNYKNGIITRGVLMDIARLKSVDYLEPGLAGLYTSCARWLERAMSRYWAAAERRTSYRPG